MEAELKEIQIERMRGTFTEEGKEYEVAYSVNCNRTFVMIKKLPSKVEKENLKIALYGHNISEDEMREFFKLCRSPV